MKIGFQGLKGAYSQGAIYSYFGINTETIGYESFYEVFRALENQEIDYGVVPIENSIGGSVAENYDLLLKEDVYVVGEIYFRIVNSLLGIPGVKLDDIKAVYSHPQPLRQSKEFLREHNIREYPVYDTAGAAKIVSEKEDKNTGAIAHEICADIYGLEIIKKGIESNKTNTTRFFVVARRNERSVGVTDKTTLAFKTKHYPGALADCLKVFDWFELNMTKIESRPIPDSPWEYAFYIEFEGGMNSEIVQKAMDKLRTKALDVKILGSYPAGNKGNYFASKSTK